MNLPFFISAKQKRQMGAQNVKKAAELELDNGIKKKGEERLGDNRNYQQTKKLTQSYSSFLGTKT
jgi:hypothetical protein